MPELAQHPLFPAPREGEEGDEKDEEEKEKEEGRMIEEGRT